MSKLLPFTLLLAALLSSGTALADEPASNEPTANESSPPVEPKVAPRQGHDDLLLTAGAGLFGEAEQARGGGLLSLTGLRQRGLLGYGATLEYGGAVLGYTTFTAAPMVGVFADGPKWLRVGIAATGGVHVYEGVGGFMDQAHASSGTTLFLGTRAFVGGEIGGSARFHIGLQLSADEDLARIHDVTYGTPSQNQTEAHTTGAFRFGGMLALGTAFDL